MDITFTKTSVRFQLFTKKESSGTSLWQYRIQKYVSKVFWDHTWKQKLLVKELTEDGDTKWKSCKYCLTGQEKTIDWIKKKISSILYEHTTVVNKRLEKNWINKKNISANIRFMEANFRWNLHMGPEKVSVLWNDCFIEVST